MHTPRNPTRKSSTLFTLDGLESRALLSTVHPLTNFLKSTHNHVTPPQPLVIPAGTIIPIDSDPLSIVNLYTMESSYHQQWFSRHILWCGFSRYFRRYYCAGCR